jgi:hypothetical protein
VKHLAETDLALYASGDLSLARGVLLRLHIARCERCRRRADAYRADRAAVRDVAGQMPPNLKWDRLAAEMTANIRVGLAAGECVAPRRPKHVKFAWRPAAAMAGLSCVLALAWWLNVPPETTRSFGRVLTAIVHGGAVAPSTDKSGLVVEADATGIEVRENGNALGVSQGSTRPVAVSVSAQGSASARYINADTGQITITSVYAQ